MYLGVGYNFLADVYIFNSQFCTMQIVGVCISIFFTLLVAINKMQLDPVKTVEREDHFVRVHSQFKVE